MAFQIGDARFEASVRSQSFLTLYLALRIIIQRLSLLEATIQANLANKALLMFLAFLNPRPPSFIGRQRLSQDFQAMNLPSR